MKWTDYNSCHLQRNCFSDTTMERNTLMAKCYPKIKDYCREKHGLEFQVNNTQLKHEIKKN